MNRLRKGLGGVIAVAAVAALLGLWYANELRQLESAARYAEMRADANQEVRVTIPEGWRREQIAALLEKSAVTIADDFLALTKNDEGHLFPDTYNFYPATAAAEVRAKLLATYNSKAPDVDANTLVIASIVEREAKTDDERSKIAGVYWNRFKIGMALQADPTVQYGKDSLALASRLKATTNRQERVVALRDFKFWQPITRADYSSVDSAFNTYRTSVLPPNPICNPGVKSLVAAQNPADHSYLYFLHKDDGRILFASTLDEHLKNQRSN
jgi:UPF0755 protein